MVYNIFPPTLNFKIFNMIVFFFAEAQLAMNFIQDSGQSKFQLNFVYSKKATKIYEIFTINLTLTE